MAMFSSELLSVCLSWLSGSVIGFNKDLNKNNDICNATSEWVGTSGDWATPADWNTNSVPSASDIAAIDAAGSYTVMVSALEAVGSVGLSDRGAILDIQIGGTLAV